MKIIKTLIPNNNNNLYAMEFDLYYDKLTEDEVVKYFLSPVIAFEIETAERGDNIYYSQTPITIDMHCKNYVIYDFLTKKWSSEGDGSGLGLTDLTELFNRKIKIRKETTE